MPLETVLGDRLNITDLFVSSNPQFCPITNYYVSFVEQSGLEVDLGEKISVWVVSASTIIPQLVIFIVMF